MRILWYEESLLSNQTQDGVQRQIVALQLLLAVVLRARSCAAGDQGAIHISVTTVKRNGTRIKRAMLPELGVLSTTNVALLLVLVKAIRSIEMTSNRVPVVKFSLLKWMTEVAIT